MLDLQGKNVAHGFPFVMFWVAGKPEPGGSKKAFVKPGTSFAQVVDDNDALKPWKKVVAATARVAMHQAGLRAPMEGPLYARFEFFLEKPKSVKREFPTVRPDSLKLARGSEDAMTGIVYGDDAQIIDEELSKRYGDPGVLITVSQHVDIPPSKFCHPEFGCDCEPNMRCSRCPGRMA